MVGCLTAIDGCVRLSGRRNARLVGRCSVRSTRWINDESVAGLETDSVANTNVIWHGGKLLALEEGHAPFELDPDTLESVGPHFYGGVLKAP